MPGAKTILPVDVFIRPDQLLDMKSGTQVFHIFGKITYNDIFGQLHFTNFCVSLQPTAPVSFSQCEGTGYNDAN